MPYLGAHMSVAGGLYRAVERITSIGGQALQVFTRNQRQWTAAPVTDEEAEAFRAAVAAWGFTHVASHDSYLINLASPHADVAAKSRLALADELVRCARLGIPMVVLHPGAHLGAGVEKGIAALADNLDAAIEEAGAVDQGSAAVMVLLENTAGQGSGLGSRFEELAGVMARSRHAQRLAVCLDTCHALAAGYDPRTDEGYAAMFEAFDKAIGLGRLRLLHLNDSKTGLGSRVDRHEHIGKGSLGLESFRRLLHDPRLAELPMVIETPKDDGDRLELDRMNLEVLRGLARRS